MEGLVPAKKAQRFAAALTDLVTIPIFLGVVVAMVLFAAPDALRSVVLVAVNILWLVVRDAFFSVGRKYPMGRKVINITTLALGGVVLIFLLTQVTQNPAAGVGVLALFIYLALAIPTVILDKGGSLKVASMNGGNVTPVQAAIRNAFLAVPFVLVTGYVCEAFRILFNNTLIGRRVVYVLVALAALGFGGMGVVALLSAPSFVNILQTIGILGAILTPVFFVVRDKEEIASGRLMDLFAKTLVVQA